MGEWIKSYKGFNPDMTCRGFQYEEGKEYETEAADCCNSGFHACGYPLDAFKYYHPANSVFHEVEQGGELSRGQDDTKVASTKLKVGASINIADMVKAAIEYTTSRTKKEAGAEEPHGASSATGDCGASSAGSPDAIAVAWGPKSKARGVLGSHLVLADWEEDYNDEFGWTLKGARMVRVDGKEVKPDTWYRIEDGKVVADEEGTDA